MTKTIDYVTIVCLKSIFRLSFYPLFLFGLGSCADIGNPEKEKLKAGLEIKKKGLYEDDKGFAHYAFFVKNNNEKTIKSAKLRLFILGYESGMFPNEVEFQNLPAGDSVYLSVNLFADYSDTQGYHFFSEVEELDY